jgi:hypothetical protein
VEVSNGEVVIDFECSSPVGQSIPNLIVEAGSALDDWNPLPSNSYIETGRQNNPALGTTRVSIRVTEPLAPSTQKKFYRARWLFQP